MKTALVISFNGTLYSGWQVQANGASVQKTLQNAIEKTLGRSVKVTGCSRTDAGVHANEYYCHLNICSPIPPDRFPLALNRLLPDDICVLKAFDAEDNFHARYSAKGKEYMYLIWNSPYKNVFYKNTAYMYKKPLDVDEINACGAGFAGKRDFVSFMARGSGVKNTVRDVRYFKAERKGDFVKIYVAADGFLYNMVRIMVGTALEICSGKFCLSPEEIIGEKSRVFAGKTMPARGLYLNKVFY
ncbi:MAG: tRNA pseudouridine(38-40) synthase TruA [Eubacteriales bacterium]